MYWKDAQTTLLKSLFDYERVGVITDVDGTISPIADHPDQAQVTPKNRELLKQLQQQLTVVGVISGRSAGDVAQRVGIPSLVYVGNHGFERWYAGAVVVNPAAREARQGLQNVIAAVAPMMLPGMQIEDKGATISIHYRGTENPEETQTLLQNAVQHLAHENGLVFFNGRMIFEIRPPAPIDKGTAFESLVEEFSLDGVVFLGDDTTDADAMRVARQIRESGACYVVSLGVESDETPQAVRDDADLLVQGISGVEDFLEWLLASRIASVS